MAAMPNAVAAVMTRVKGCSDMIGLITSTDGYKTTAVPPAKGTPRIATFLQDHWLLPSHCMLLRRSGGPLLEADRDTRIRNTRIDFWHYGPGKNDAAQEEAAYTLWRTVHPHFAELGSGGTWNSETYVANDCRIYGVYSETDPITFLDQDTGWRVIIAPYIVVWSEVGVP